jgi:acylglycerol lipase
MAPENDFILSKDGLTLSIHHWKCEKPSHVLCVIHGLGEHGRRYAHVAEFLLQNNIATVAIDHRGHGKSEGKKGHTKSYDHMLSDVEELLKYTRLEYIDTPIVLYGHSMGGNLVTSYVLQKTISELAGFILSAPFFEVAFEPPAWKIKLAKFIGGLLPGLLQSNELEVEAISRIPEEVQKYKDDPLVHDRISVRLFLSLTQAGQKALSSSKKIEKPGLIFHGSDDRLVSYEASDRFRQKHPELEWHSLDGVYHEPHNDSGKEKVLEVIKDFIQRV